ncbi:MAG: methyltransferase domain-containing protein [Thermoleophilum sp.]|nr:methyltransferase domain-containing protein [Thermoleophilum sp.]
MTPSRYDDEIWELVPDREFPPDPRVVRFLRSLGRFDRALDLGCGDGRHSGLVDCRELVLADVSARALERAVRRGPRHATAVEIEPDSALPFADASFDLVVAVDVIEHVRDTQLWLSEVRRVLRPGGCFALTTPAHSRLDAIVWAVRGLERHFDPFSPHLRIYTARSLTRALRDLGFDPVAVRRGRGLLLARATAAPLATVLAQR